MIWATMIGPALYFLPTLYRDNSYRQGKDQYEYTGQLSRRQK
jgi:hypothetical protein